ncbi:MAG: class I SAM-dependent RNA methyltransferase [Alphaproteobacteria bacterium]|nr:class I SAM-dependent RNA methyltransferase [Alphaproteobacteria bacterium]
MSAPVELLVETLGAGGDGIAHWQGRTVALPATVPGERVHARLASDRRGRITATVLARLADGQDRVAAPCPYFGACGGCRLQHLNGTAYRRWKEAQVVRALSARGLDLGVLEPLVATRPARRRVVLHARRAAGAGEVGYFAAASHRLVPVGDCPALAPELARLIAPLAALVGEVRGARVLDAALTLADTGVDAVLGLDGAPDLAFLERLAAFATAADLARLSWRADGMLAPVVERRAVLMTFANTPVALPPDAFIQPSREAEEVLAALVAEGVGGAAHVADLYAGCGTFALRLAGAARVHAIEGDRAMAEALRLAGRGFSGRLTVEHRDLARRPLSPQELAPFDAVVLDPPRAGAEPMARALAAAKVARVAMVSCDPVSLARDARILVDGGYRLMRVIPVDQFVWTAEIEVFALFRRAD